MAGRRWAYERGALWASEATDPRVAPAQPRAMVVFSEVRRETAGRLVAAAGWSDPKALLERFDGQRRCFAAWDGQRIAAYGWASQGQESVGELERSFRMLSGEAYIWDCATLPEYRGQGIYSALLSHMQAQLRSAGVGRIWIGASLNNQPSLKGFINAGFRPAIELTYLRVLVLRFGWMRRSPGAPASLAAAARRMIMSDDERALGPLFVGIRRRKGGVREAAPLE
jgi:ribosomal protein S18 acetylase RimI-like enzyme